MAQGHLPSGQSFESLMASLKGEKAVPPVSAGNALTPIERMREANRRLQEATARLKQSSTRLEYSVSNLQAAVTRLLEKYPELRDDLSSNRSHAKK